MGSRSSVGDNVDNGVLRRAAPDGAPTAQTLTGLGVPVIALPVAAGRQRLRCGRGEGGGGWWRRRRPKVDKKVNRINQKYEMKDKDTEVFLPKTKIVTLNRQVG